MSQVHSVNIPRAGFEGMTLERFGFFSLGAALFATAYSVTFLHGGLPLGDAFRNALVNVGTAYFLGILVCGMAAALMQGPWALQLTAHVIGAATYAWAWHFFIRLAFAVSSWLETGVFAIHGVPRSVLTWQLCQGLVVYALLVCATLALVFQARGHTSTSVSAEVSSLLPLHRFLTRRGDMIEPVSVEEIVMVEGAGDYSQVITRHGAHLVRILLGELEERLDSGRFLRVHRSKIINLDHMLSIEPGGAGRMLVHMRGGHMVAVSRSGAQRLREMLL